MSEHGTSRRDALKKAGVGTAAAGVAWSAPRVDGLSLRPEYAGAQTGGGDADAPGAADFTWSGDGSVVLPVSGPSFTPSLPNVTGGFVAFRPSSPDGAYSLTGTSLSNCSLTVDADVGGAPYDVGPPSLASANFDRVFAFGYAAMIQSDAAWRATLHVICT